MEKRRILLVSNMYPSKKYPHYGIFVKHTGDILAKAGYDVDVVSLEKKDTKIQKLFAYSNFYLKILIKSLKSYDVIYAHYASHVALPLIISNLVKKNKIVLNVHGNDVVPEDKNDLKYIKLVKRLIGISDLIICPSNYFMDILKDNYEVDEDKIRVYPSGGVDTELFTNICKEEALEKLGLDKSKKYLGYVSRIEICKGWDIFLQASSDYLHDNKDTDLIVVGAGNQENEFFFLAKELNIEHRIIKFDLVSQDKLKYLFNAMDVFAFSTYRKSESLGLVGLEAMSCETLTILPDRYGPASYGKNGINCIEFEAGNANSLKEAIYNAFEITEEEYKRITKNARLTAKEYDLKTTQNDLLSIFKSIFEK